MKKPPKTPPLLRAVSLSAAQAARRQFGTVAKRTWKTY
jgi:hypothetical protein